MKFLQLLTLFRQADKQTWLFLSLALLGLLSLGLGSYFTYQTQFSSLKYQYIPADKAWQDHLQDVVEVSQEQKTEDTRLMVDVSGAVQKPGIYELSPQSRLQDAVLMAGGFAEEADKQFIHQQLNLASQLRDQQKIYVPWEGEQSALSSAEVKEVDSMDVVAKLNNFTQSQLEELAGIGEKRAQQIIAARPYTDKDDFAARAGISQAMAESILQELISI